ncbi:hypothetical protein CH373_08450 [Leptospira perolatii]|uniref:DUF1574 domain-containing protein n=1 Tax=Leptospira perolatii TaxID=2023191 RepID=A0A2M9ZN90_9LEPT|nr:hypothetical protein [Leptospira perolatii]PJZ68691.1 hypothetical protein CH360_14945 [Leptospira perolatii]PJZ73527.1 hypothetical protein CH373_08450 [Leptospira perolatii]
MQNKALNYSIALLLFTLLVIGISHLLFPAFLNYQDKNYFLYDKLSGIPQFSVSLPKRIEGSHRKTWVFLGDSQILSGLYPQKIADHTGNRIYFLPRPSEQPEGILLRLEDLRQNGIVPDKIFFNASLFNTAQGGMAPAHKSMEVHFGSFHFAMYFISELRSFYLKGGGEPIFYALARIFPLLKLNAAISSEIRFSPSGDQFSLFERNLDLVFSFDPILRWKSNFRFNQNLESELTKNHGMIEWGKQGPYTGECIPNFRHVALPPGGWELGYKVARDPDLRTWKKIFEILQKEKIQFELVLVPSRPSFENAIREPNSMQFFETSIRQLGIPFSKPEVKFLDQDYGDHTHLNACGIRKLTDWFLKRYSEDYKK